LVAKDIIDPKTLLDPAKGRLRRREEATMAKSTIISEVLGSCKKELFTGFVFSFFINSLMLTMPLYMMSVFSRVLTSHSYMTLMGLFAMALLAFGVMGALMYLRDRMMERLASKIDVQFSDILMVNTLKNGTINNAPRNGQVLRDLRTIRQFLGGNQMTFIFDAPWIPVFLIFLLMLNYPMGIFAIFSAVVLGVLSWVSERSLSEPQAQADLASRESISNAEAMLRNGEVIQAMGMRGRFLDRWRQSSGVALVTTELANSRAARFYNFSRTYRMVMQISVMTVGAAEVMEGTMNAAVMFVGSIMMGRLLMPMEGLIGIAKNFSTIRETLRRLDSVIRAFPEEGEIMILPPPQGTVDVQQVSYRPPQSEKVILRNVNFALAPGDNLGIVGPSGSGKTTLGKMLVGALIPSGGCVRLDGADLSQWHGDLLGPHIGYLPQDVMLFDASIRDNIARLDDTADPEAIIQAARLAGIHEFILQLPNGYDTVIGPGGHVLSGGQRQRVGLARALFGDPRLVVLDEPNSNLDVNGEKALMRALGHLKAIGSTTVVITHRPSILSDVDKVLVMRDGAVEMFGGRDSVLQRILPDAAKKTPRLAANS